MFFGCALLQYVHVINTKHTQYATFTTQKENPSIEVLFVQHSYVHMYNHRHLDALICLHAHLLFRFERSSCGHVSTAEPGGGRGMEGARPASDGGQGGRRP